MKRYTIYLASSSFVLLCTLQTLYWPLLPKPGTVIEWWQVRFLAKIGYIVGAPVIMVIAESPLHGFSQTLLASSLAFIWAAVVFFVLRAVSIALCKRSRHAA